MFTSDAIILVCRSPQSRCMRGGSRLWGCRSSRADDPGNFKPAILREFQTSVDTNSQAERRCPCASRPDNERPIRGARGSMNQPSPAAVGSIPVLGPTRRLPADNHEVFAHPNNGRVCARSIMGLKPDLPPFFIFSKLVQLLIVMRADSLQTHHLYNRHTPIAKGGPEFFR